MRFLEISTESVVLMTICLLDMVSTLIFVSLGAATEFNPIMAVFIGHSPLLFIAVKLASFLPFVVSIEIYRRYNPRFALLACRYAIGAYVVVFIAFTAGINLR